MAILDCFFFLLQYIRSCISRGEIPQLCLYSRRDVYASLPESVLHIPSYMRRSVPPQPIGSPVSLWQLNTQFRVHILWATYVNVRDIDMVIYIATWQHQWRWKKDKEMFNMRSIFFSIDLRSGWHLPRPGAALLSQRQPTSSVRFSKVASMADFWFESNRSSSWCSSMSFYLFRFQEKKTRGRFVLGFIYF